MSTPTKRRPLLRTWMVGAMGVVAISLLGCSHEDSKPTRPERDGLGPELFGVLCDRVGAQALREDLSGASYQEVCHGQAMTVDASRLPPAPNSAVRAQAVAKIEALARHRNALVAALNVVFPDDEVVGKQLDSADPASSCDPVSGRARREQLRGLLGRILPTPDEKNETVPESSRALARSIEPLLGDEGKAARDAMTHLAARRGYMPPEVSAGLLGTVLTAPSLRDALSATTRLISHDSKPYDAPNTAGVGYATFSQFVTEAKRDLREPVEDQAPLTISYDAGTDRAVLSRPRTLLELGREILLTEHPDFSNGPPLLVARRDSRGMAVIAKKDGKLPALFVDADGDGLADLDERGRFKVTDEAKRPADPFVGAVRSPAYEYIDARATAASALLRHLSPLSDPDGGKESLVSAFEALLLPLLREEGRDVLLDLVHAGGQISADPATDELLALSGKLFADEPQLMARVLGDLLDAKAILDAHPEAKLPDGSTLVDDLVNALVKIGQEPGLLEDVLAAMGDDRAALLSKALPPMLMFKDRLTYDRQSINAPPVNAVTGKAGPPEIPVDRSQPIQGWNRSLFHRFLQLIHDTRGVTACSKEGGILHAIVSLDGGETYTEVPFPFGGTAPECGLLKIEDLATYYLRSMVGDARLHFRNDLLTPMVSPEVIRRSTGLVGTWPSNVGEDVRPRPEMLNRLVFFDVLKDSPNEGDINYKTNFVINELQGPFIGSSACPERVIDDPNLGDADVAPDGKVRGLRTCKSGQSLQERNADTLFVLEYNNGYDALTPLTEVFLKHKKEQMLLDLLDLLLKHWSVDGGVVKAEPALAEILGKTQLVASLGELTKATRKMVVSRCKQETKGVCNATESVPAMTVLAGGLRAFLDPAAAQRRGVVDRHGKTTSASGAPLSLFSMVRDGLRAEDALLAKKPGREAAWLAARSNMVDEFLRVIGRGPDAKLADPGIARVAPAIINALRAQRNAKCNGDTSCPALRKDLAVDLEDSLKKPLTRASLDLVDVFLNDPVARREVGRLTSYLTRQQGPLGTAGSGLPQVASSTPFTTSRGPGVLDQSIAALVDALGSLGDLRDLRPFYPILAHMLGELDPQLSLLSRLNARAYDAAGHEICSRELDPEETLSTSLSRLALVVSPKGEPSRAAIQIFLDAIADVNRVDPSNNAPLEGDDYKNVFSNVHSLLTDPTGGLEQLYASVRQATATKEE